MASIVNKIEKRDWCHCGGGFGLMVLSIFSLFSPWNIWVSILLVIALCLYLAVIVGVCAFKSDKATTGTKTLELPESWSLLFKNAEGETREFSSGAGFIVPEKIGAGGKTETLKFLPESWSLLFKNAEGKAQELLPEAWSLSLKSGEGDNAKNSKLPSRLGSFLLFLFLLVANVTAFANIYVKTDQIQKPAKAEQTQQPVKPDETLELNECIKELNECIKDKTEVMRDPLDAFYFSAVTLTTLGYGEFRPIGSDARLAVVCQLASGVLLLLFGVPIVASRISSW
ncbi:MAG: two pore domain potassium channel family protein [Nitrospinaceae bacterium]|jgi:hypothetical protein|nr:two pore domain potassium channel family protein [Nitrospinaceae bacterium]